MDDLKNVLKEIQDNKAELIGESNWYKDSAYQAYKVDDKFYVICVYDSSSVWLMDGTLQEIKESEINDYI